MRVRNKLLSVVLSAVLLLSSNYGLVKAQDDTNMTVSTAAAISADNSATGFTTSGLNEEETTSTTDLAAETLPAT